MLEVPRPYYSRALKSEAVRRVLLEGKGPAHVARELALSEQTVRHWVDDKANQASIIDTSARSRPKSLAEGDDAF